MIGYLIVHSSFCHRSHSIRQVPIIQYLVLAQTTFIRSVMLLSYLVFIIECTQSDRSQKLSFVFGIDCIYTITRIVVLYGFHHSRHLIRLVMIVQYRFRHKPHLYNQSSHCPLQFLSQTTPVWSVMTVHYRFHCRSHMYNHSPHCPLWFSSHTTPDQIGLDNSVSISPQTKLIRSITSLSYLVFITKHTQFDQSRQLSFTFSIDRICTISHIFLLYGFHHNQHPIRLVTTVQYCFSAQITLVQSVTLLSYLVFVTDDTQSDRS